MGIGNKSSGLYDGIAESTSMVSLGEINMDMEEAAPTNFKIDPLPPNFKPRLEIIEGPHTGQILKIEKPMVILGRIPDVADIVIPCSSASRSHASITFRQGQFYISDLGSTNGTEVDGKMVSEAPLSLGSKIAIGDNVFIFTY